LIRSSSVANEASVTAYRVSDGSYARGTGTDVDGTYRIQGLVLVVGAAVAAFAALVVLLFLLARGREETIEPARMRG
jgi:hypothetical protein